MRNYVHAGDVMPLTAPYAVATGGGFLVGSLFAVAAAAAGSGAAVQGHTRGVFILTALSTDTGSECARVFWDDTNRRCTVSASGNTLIGCLAAAKTNGQTTMRVRLNGVA